MVALGPLVLIALIVLVVVLASRGGQGTRPGPEVPAPRVDEELIRWTAAGLVSEEQAKAIRAYEQGLARTHPVASPGVGAPAPGSPAGTGPGSDGARRRPRRVPVVAEALGYLGAILAVVGVVLLVARYWPDMATAGRLALSGAVAGGLLLAGLLVHAEADPAFARLRAFVLLASTAATALFVGVLVTDAYGTDAAETVVLACAIAVALHSGLLWAWRDRPVQQLVFLAGLTVAAGAAVAEVTRAGPVGMVVWAVGALFVTSGVRRLIPQPLLTEGVGAAAVVVGAAITAGQWQGFGLAFLVATAGGLLALAAVPGLAPERTDHIVTAIIGGLAMLQAAPSTIGYFARDAGVLTGVIVWTVGVTWLAVGDRRLVRAPVAAEVLGGMALIGGAAITGVQAHGFAPIFGMATAVVMVGLGMLPGHVLMSVFGSLGLLINVPWAIGRFFPGEGRAPLLILVSGALILAVAVLLARMGGRFRRELGGADRRPGASPA